MSKMLDFKYIYIAMIESYNKHYINFYGGFNGVYRC